MLRYFSPLLLLFFTLTAYSQPTFFKVRVENVGQAFPLSQSGVFNTPVDSTGPGPLFPGASYEFSFDAAPGSYLSFATMFVQSNDLFYGPDEAGIALYDMMGMPVSGDLTSQLDLWDSGTEENESPGEGMNQAPRQSGPNTGPADPDTTVRLVNDGFTYPADEDVIQFTLTHNGGTSFTATITNVSSDTTLTLAGGGTAPVPLAPGVFVVHTDPAPLFTVGEEDRGEGLEGIAEDGDPSMSAASVASQTGITAVLAPGVFVVHGTDDPLFTVGMADFGNGLEGIAEDGNPGMQAGVLKLAPNMTGGAFAVPVGAMGPGPLPPGEAYEFVIASGSTGKLSLATMFVQSNDLFYAPDGMGIDLFDAGGMPISGDITAQFDLWDAGTELNEIPGIGVNQAPRQSGPNTGAADTSTAVRLVNDGYTYPADEDVIQVSIMPLEEVNFTVRIENVSGDTTLFINDTTTAPVPLAPGAWAIHSTPDPMFTVGEADYGFGLEGIAEDGNAGDLGTWLAAKMGTPSGVFNTPVDSAGPGPLFPGAAYEFNITAAPGMYLSLATMFVQSNDLFYAPDGSGIPLFDMDGTPVSGDVTPMFDLWDAGTEENEQPGVGMNQAPRQTGPNTGPVDSDSLVRLITDSFVYPDDEEVIRVIITPEPQTSIDPLRPDNTSLVELVSFPNPFQEQATIRLHVQERMKIGVDIFSLSGQKVAQLQTAESLLPGQHDFQWDGTDLRGNQVAPGLYLIRVNGGKAGVASELLLKR
ncbi:MAG: spondin domain-containing protein [Bacteroidota bacterium]